MNRGGNLRVKAASHPLAAKIVRHPTITSLNFTRFESNDGFSAIAMAIKENSNLNSLRLASCSLSTAQAADLNRLLATKVLEVFTLVECSSSSNQEVLCISGGLRTQKKHSNITNR
jgi:hypothetical protein